MYSFIGKVWTYDPNGVFSFGTVKHRMSSNDLKAALSKAELNENYEACIEIYNELKLREESNV